ncbi:hypothetical protein EVA_19117 [gut metagenome]|uniref:Uncharacterized protein n=1 Tax=gut metagenome TaxID=749906 RepID=J9FCZ8_9ZZZZ
MSSMWDVTASTTSLTTRMSLPTPGRSFCISCPSM